MNTRERIASDIAERIGTVGRYKCGPASWHTMNAHFFNEQFEAKVTNVLEALLEAERKGLIVFVTDDAAVFKFPVESYKESQHATR